MKYYIKIHDESHSRAVQARLFELGWDWSWGAKGKPQKTNPKDPHNFAKEIEVKDDQTLDWCAPYSSGFFANKGNRELTLDTLYSPENPLLKPQEVRVNLNSAHFAIVTKGGITVGCQTFPHSIVPELAAAIAKINS